MTPITDPLAIYETIREDQRAEDNRRRYIPKSQRVRVAQIALASPENVLALLDEVERLRELVYRIEDLAERWTNSADPVTECRGEELAEALS